MFGCSKSWVLEFFVLSFGCFMHCLDAKKVGEKWEELFFFLWFQEMKERSTWVSQVVVLGAVEWWVLRSWVLTFKWWEFEILICCFWTPFSLWPNECSGFRVCFGVLWCACWWRVLGVASGKNWTQFWQDGWEWCFHGNPRDFFGSGAETSSFSENWWFKHQDSGTILITIA